MAGQRVLVMVPIGALELSPTVDDIEWQSRAACRNYPDPDIWYSNNQGDIKVARKFCHDCPVQVDCLEYAVKYDDPWGLWGGQRQGERRRRKRSPGGASAGDVSSERTAEVATSSNVG